MPSLHVRVPHMLPQQEARERLIRFIDLLREHYGDRVSDLQQSWDGDTLQFRFKAYGFKLEGQITVADHELDAQAKLPLSAMIFRHRIEAAIRDELARLMAT
jgi:hypothetical protein